MLLAVALGALSRGLGARGDTVGARRAVTVAVALAVLVATLVVGVVVTRTGRLRLLATHHHQDGAQDAAEQQQQTEDQHRSAPPATDVVGAVTGEQLTLGVLALGLVGGPGHAVGAATDLPVLLAVGLHREVLGRLTERGGVAVRDHAAPCGATVTLLGAVDGEGGRFHALTVGEPVQAHLRAGQRADQHEDQTEEGSRGRNRQHRVLVAGRIGHADKSSPSWPSDRLPPRCCLRGISRRWRSIQDDQASPAGSSTGSAAART